MRIVIIQRDSGTQPTHTYFIDDPKTMETLSDLVRTIQNLSSKQTITKETEK